MTIFDDFMTFWFLLGFLRKKNLGFLLYNKSETHYRGERFLFFASISFMLHVTRCMFEYVKAVLLWVNYLISHVASNLGTNNIVCVMAWYIMAWKVMSCNMSCYMSMSCDLPCEMSHHVLSHVFISCHMLCHVMSHVM